MYGFLEQLLHYFDRPHVAPATAPVGGPAAWRGDALAGSDAWRERLDAGQVAELKRAVETARATGRPTAALSAHDFPLPSLQAAIARWRAELRDGRGFVLISGFPVEAWSPDEAEVAFWCLGSTSACPARRTRTATSWGTSRT